MSNITHTQYMSLHKHSGYLWPRTQWNNGGLIVKVIKSSSHTWALNHLGHTLLQLAKKVLVQNLECYGRIS